ncbi:MAG: hypothetical protein DK306_000628 [Chloroflexi bacterium]|nr:MAG: hypothetical protein DK306_000628 [Chloroflexota bacterium]
MSMNEHGDLPHEVEHDRAISHVVQTFGMIDLAVAWLAAGTLNPRDSAVGNLLARRLGTSQLLSFVRDVLAKREGWPVTWCTDVGEAASTILQLLERRNRIVHAVTMSKLEGPPLRSVHVREFLGKDPLVGADAEDIYALVDEAETALADLMGLLQVMPGTDAE